MTENLLQLSLIHVTYAVRMRIWPILLLIPALASGGEIYTRDGVTDGDTFYLAPAAFSNDDPAYQSWVAYSLMKSTCQLEIGGENPARASSFDCEFTARRHLITTWEEKRAVDPGISDRYLDALGEVHAAGFLGEYTARYHGRKQWALPEGLRVKEFRGWSKEHLRGHRAKTRIIGSWNYQRRVTEPPY